jgi:hypothetical protein
LHTDWLPWLQQNGCVHVFRHFVYQTFVIYTCSARRNARKLHATAVTRTGRFMSCTEVDELQELLVLFAQRYRFKKVRVEALMSDTMNVTSNLHIPIENIPFMEERWAGQLKRVRASRSMGRQTAVRVLSSEYNRIFAVTDPARRIASGAVGEHTRRAYAARVTLRPASTAALAAPVFYATERRGPLRLLRPTELYEAAQEGDADGGLRSSSPPRW